MAALLYFITAVATLAVVNRVIVRIDRRFALILLLLPLVLTGRALLTGSVYAPADLAYQSFPLRAMAEEAGIGGSHNPTLSDLYAQHIPWKKAVRDAYLGGEWPLWNPYQFAGDILAASGQPAPYDPLLLISLLIPMAHSLTFLASMTLFLFALWMFVWLREIGSSERASIFGAVAWMLGSFVLFWLEWPMAATIAWLPLVLTGVRRVLHSIKNGTVLLTTAFVLMLLAGHPESALHVVAVGGVLTLWHFALARTIPLAAIGRLTAAGVLALILTSFYLFPILEAVSQTIEHFHREAIFAEGSRSVTPSEAGARLATNFVPFVYGAGHEEVSAAAPGYIPLATAYAGSVILPLVVFALWRSKRRDRWLFAGLGLLGLLMGIDAPVAADLLAALPLFDIAINNRLIFVALFAFAVLSAFGIDAWLESMRKDLALSYAILAAAFAMGVAILWPWMRQSGLSAEFLTRESLLLVVPLALAALVLSLDQRRRFAFAALLLLLIAQRGLESGHVYPTVPARAFYPPVPELESLPRDGTPYRVVGLDHTFIPATATMYGLEDVRGYQAMTSKRWKNTYPLWGIHQPVWFNRVLDLTRPFLSFLNVRYAIAEPGNSAPEGWRVVAESERMTLLENQRFIERAFVPERLRFNLPVREALFEMALERDFSRRSWIDHPWSEVTRGEIANGPGRVAVRAPSMKRRDLTISMENPGWVVVSELNWKGWRAFRNGERVHLRVANHAFLAFHVPAGEHEVTLVYWPRAFVNGAVVSSLTLIALLSWWAIRLSRRRRG